MKMQRRSLLTAFATLALSAALAPTASADLTQFETASADSIIQPGGPRTTSGGSTLVNYFYNVEGSNNGSNASWAPSDYSGFSMGLTSLSQLTSFQIALTEVNAGFSHSGLVGVFLSTDTTTNIGLGSPLTFQTGTALPTGLDSQLSNAVGNPLATYTFPQTGSGNNGTVDTINLLPGLAGLNGTAQADLLAALNGGGDIRLVIAPLDTTVAATWAGIGNTSSGGPFAAPVLEANVVPEPSSALLMGLGFVAVAAGLALRRRAACA